MNYFQTLKFGSDKLKLSNLNTHMLDSELLLSYSLNLPREQILINLDAKIKKNKLNLFKKLIYRREKKNRLHILQIKKNFGKIIFT